MLTIQSHTGDTEAGSSMFNPTQLFNALWLWMTMKVGTVSAEVQTGSSAGRRHFGFSSRR